MARLPAAASYVASTAAAGPVATEHLWMLKPGQWRPVCRLDVHVGEAFLCVHSLLLRQGASGTTEPVIALGLGMSHGEDFPAYGRAVFATLSRKDAPSVQEAALGMVWDIRTKFRWVPSSSPVKPSWGVSCHSPYLTLLRPLATLLDPPVALFCDPLWPSCGPLVAFVRRPLLDCVMPRPWFPFSRTLAPQCSPPRSTQFKGPVTAIQQVQDRVVIVAGGLILVSEWTEGGLEQQQQLHFDRQDTFVIGMRAAGAWLATVDFVRGTRLIQFHPEADEFKHKSVHAGRLTPHALEVLSTSGDTAATLALADAGGCLYMMEHRPDTDWKGEQIVVHSRIFLASVAEKLLLVPLPADLDVVLPGALLCCHLDGSVGVLLTVSAEASSAMRAATRAGMGRVATAAGLHPLAFRSSKGRGAGAPAGLSFEVGFSEPELAVDGDFLVELSKAPRAQRDAVLGALQADGDVAARAMGLVEECLRHFL